VRLGSVVAPAATWLTVPLATPLYFAVANLFFGITMVIPLIALQWFLLAFNLTARELFKPHDCPYLHGRDAAGERVDWWASLNTFNRGLLTNCWQFVWPPEDWIPLKPAGHVRPSGLPCVTCSGCVPGGPSETTDLGTGSQRPPNRVILHFVLHIVGILFFLRFNRVWPSTAALLGSGWGLGALGLAMGSLLAFRRLIQTSPGYVTDRVTEIDPEQALGYCGVCRVPMPLRSHHCDACNRCVYTWDHHCGWSGCCIGGNNRPAFLRFLVLQTALLWVAVIIAHQSFSYSIKPITWTLYIVPLDIGIAGPSNDNPLFAELALHVTFWLLLPLALALSCLTHRHLTCCCCNLLTPELCDPWEVPYLRHTIDADDRVAWLRVGMTFHRGTAANLRAYFFDRPINWKSPHVDLNPLRNPGSSPSGIPSLPHDSVSVLSPSAAATCV